MDIEKISKYLLTTVLKLLKGVPDLWRADVSRIIKELKEMVELESHAGERQRSVIRAHREFLVDEAVERLAYETYTRKGLRFWANQQELVCGYFSLFLVGGLYGIDVGLLLLVCVMSQDMNGAAAVGKLLIAFAVTASSTILAAMIGKRIYTHVALRKQFRLDILERIRDGGSGMDASFTQAMEKSYKRLHEYEETRRVWKYRILVLSCLLTASLLVLVAAMAFNWWSGLIRCIGAVALWGPFLVLTVVLLRTAKQAARENKDRLGKDIDEARSLLERIDGMDLTVPYLRTRLMDTLSQAEQAVNDTDDSESVTATLEDLMGQVRESAGL